MSYFTLCHLVIISFFLLLYFLSLNLAVSFLQLLSVLWTCIYLLFAAAHVSKVMFSWERLVMVYLSFSCSTSVFFFYIHDMICYNLTTRILIRHTLYPQIYMYRCVKSQYELIKEAQAPNIVQLYWAVPTIVIVATSCPMHHCWPSA